MSSWGRLSRLPHEVVAIADRSRVAAVLATSQPGIAYGNGRSYGDACLNDGGLLWSTRGLDRFIAFDPVGGVLEAEAGVTLAEVIALTLPHHWFPPVTPGTQHVTLGGALAHDIHGKNHHAAGTFGEHVEAIVLRRTDGGRIACGPQARADWYHATVGGMGLTGVVESLRLRLRRVAGPWIRATATAFDSLDGFFAASAEAATRHEHSVAWVDCTSAGRGAPRGLLFAGDHEASDRPLPTRRPRRCPLTPPFSLVTPATVRPFNALYHRRQGRRPSVELVPYTRFFYPLDGLLDWNRLYGPRGFYQYQCVVPPANERDAIGELLGIIGAARAGSFLAVLKTFGEREPAGLLSFPMPGTTLAVDVPNRGAPTRALFERLDAVVAAAGGRLYAAKDARMPASLFRHGYPRWTELEPYRDPGVSSAMSRRLFGR